METTINDLLQEDSPAAKKAKQMGLTYAGYAKWKNKKGVTVAKTVDGKLVPIKSKPSTAKQSVSGPTQPKEKLSKVDKVIDSLINKSAIRAEVNVYGTRPDAPPWQRDVNKYYNRVFKIIKHNLKLFNDNKISANDAADNIADVTYPAVNEDKLDRLLRKIIQHKAKTEQISFQNIENDRLRRFAKNTHVKGEELKIYPHDDVESILREIGNIKFPHFRKSSMLQAKTWRLKLPPKISNKLFKIQSDWVEGNAGDMHSKPRNKFLNEVIGNTKNPAIIRTSKPVCRGMSFDNAHTLQHFLNNFKVGNIVTIPPAGFSANSKTAKSFMELDEDNFGVMIRLHPRHGKLVGLQIVGSGDVIKNHINKTLWPKIKREIQIRNAKMRKYIRQQESKGRYPREYILKKIAYPYTDSGGYIDTFDYDPQTDSSNLLYKMAGYDYPTLQDDNSDEYPDEEELIIPGNAACKVLKIKKIIGANITEGGSGSGGYYLIDLQFKGLTKNKKLIKEFSVSETPQQKKLRLYNLAALYKYLNNSVHFFKKKESTEALEKMSGPLHQNNNDNNQ